jgi:uracil-DNA glycosylase
MIVRLQQKNEYMPRKKTSDKTDKMRKVRDEVWELSKSPLYDYRKKNKYYPVLGEGNHDADILFIGEAPGKNEAETGRPFCGAAGRVLTELIESIGFVRSDVYITNIVKDRPPDNRDPTLAEIAIYSPFLDRQIEIIQPKVIATLGRFSMSYMLDTYNLPEKGTTIGQLRGTQLKLLVKYGTAIFVPLYHPAVALYNGGNKGILLEDFKVLKGLI